MHQKTSTTGGINIPDWNKNATLYCAISEGLSWKEQQGISLLKDGLDWSNQTEFLHSNYSIFKAHTCGLSSLVWDNNSKCHFL